MADRITILSTQERSGWGGSEELWLALANYFLSNRTGHLQLVLFDSMDLEGKLQLFDTDRVQILRYKRNQQTFLGKIGNRFYSKKYPFNKKVLSSILKFKPDYVLVSQPDTSSFSNFYFGSVRTQLVVSNIPYFLLNQHSFDYGPIRGEVETIRSTINHAMGNFFVAHRNMQTVNRQVCMNGSNSFVVNNPVNLTAKGILEFPPLAENDEVVFATVARFECAFKGQDLLLQALSDGSWANRSWKLLLYGVGPDRQYLEDCIRYFKLESKVFIKGFATDIRKVWSEAHLLILPSISEGTPLSLAEAMLCGRPAVATDVGGNGELVEEGVTGFLAFSPEPHYLKLCLENAWKERYRWKEMGEKAYRNAISRYKGDMGEQLLSKMDGLMYD